MFDSNQHTLWEWALWVDGLNPYYWRQDFRGRLIHRNAYGLRFHPYGWEKGHIRAAADGGSDGLWNLQAEHWQTNLEKENERQQRERERKQVDAFFGMLSATLPSEYKSTPLNASSSQSHAFNGLLAARSYMPEPTFVPESKRPLFGYSAPTPFMGGLRSYDPRHGL